MNKKIKIRQLVFNKDPRNPHVLHYGLTDTKGRAWERYSDRPSGVWEEIEPPDEPNEARPRSRARGASKLRRQRP